MSRHKCTWIWLLRFVCRFIRNENVLFNRRVPNHLTIIELIQASSILFRVRYSLQRSLFTVKSEFWMISIHSPLNFGIIELGLFSFELTKAITLALFWGIFWYWRVASPIFFAKDDVPSVRIHPFDFEAKWWIASIFCKSLPITKKVKSLFLVQSYLSEFLQCTMKWEWLIR